MSGYRSIFKFEKLKSEDNLDVKVIKIEDDESSFVLDGGIE